MVKAHTATIRTSIRLTKTAMEKMGGFGISERSFFVADKAFKVFIERYPSNADGELSVALILDSAENVRLAGMCSVTTCRPFGRVVRRTAPPTKG